jgi:hypothetical protein
MSVKFNTTAFSKPMKHSKYLTFNLLLISLFLTLLSTTNALRIAVITDVHLNMTNQVPNDLGRYGEDSTMELFDLMIEDLHNKYHSYSHIRHMLN